MALETSKDNNSKPKRKPVKDPLSNKSYEDPLKKKYVDYKVKPMDLTSRLQIPKYQEYIAPDIDPLTGKPRVHRPREEPVQNKVQKEPKKIPQYFPKQLGSTVGSVKRTFSIQDNLNF